MTFQIKLWRGLVLTISVNYQRIFNDRNEM